MIFPKQIVVHDNVPVTIYTQNVRITVDIVHMYVVLYDHSLIGFA